MKELSQLQAPAGARHKKKRVGRGPGCHGKTSGRGHKGQNARSGGRVPPGFEGGQMPLIRRLPKRGFTNIWRTECAIVNVRELDRFDDDTVVDPDTLVQSGLIKRRHGPVKILGQGELQKRLVVHAHKFSKSAQQKIEACGGKTEILGV